MSIELEAIIKVVKAWNSIAGNPYNSIRATEKWLIEEMKPAIDQCREIIRNEAMKR